MPKLPGPEDLGYVQAPEERPVGQINAAPLAQGAERLGAGISKLGGNLSELAATRANQSIDNAKTGLATSYLNNRIKFGQSNDPDDLDRWKAANQAAESQYSAAVPPAGAPFGDRAAALRGELSANEGLHIAERGHQVATSSAEAGVLQNLNALDRIQFPIDESRPDVASDTVFQNTHGYIDAQVKAGHLTLERAQQYRDLTNKRYVEALQNSGFDLARRYTAAGRSDQAEAVYTRLASMHGIALRPRNPTSATASGGQYPYGAASVTALAETNDPTLGPKAIGNISSDTNGSLSYGFMGLNSGTGSVHAFARDYGPQFGLTAAPGTAAFNQQWRAASNNNTDAFRSAQLDYFHTKIAPSIGSDLQALGVPAAATSDPRVQTYFADRAVQMSTLGLEGAATAWRRSGGDVPAFLRGMNDIDSTPEALQNHFHSALHSGVYSAKGHATRLATRLNGALAAGAPPPSGPTLAPISSTGALAAASVPPSSVPPNGAPPITLVSADSDAPPAAQPAGQTPVQQFPAAGPQPPAIRASLPAGAPSAAQPAPRTVLQGIEAAEPHPLAEMVSAYTSPDERYRMARRIEVERRAAEIEGQRATASQGKAQKAGSEENELRIFSDLHQNPENPTYTLQKIIDMGQRGELSREGLERMVNLYEKATGETAAGQQVKTYGAMFHHYFEAVHAPEGDPTRLADPSQLYPLLGKGLTLAGIDKLAAEMKNHGTPEGEAEGAMKREFLRYARGEISGSDEGLHLKDPKGDELYLKFLARALPDYDAGLKNGKTPTQLLNPDSPDYVGKSIATFKRPMDQWFSDSVNGNPQTPPAPAAAPKIDISTANSPQELQALYATAKGAITQQQAIDYGVSRGWWKPRAAAPAPAATAAPQVPISKFADFGANSQGPGAQRPMSDDIAWIEKQGTGNKSENIDDRRAETMSWLRDVVGLSGSQIWQTLRHPATPFWDLFPDEYKNPKDIKAWLKSGDSAAEGLAKEAGRDDIYPEAERRKREEEIKKEVEGWIEKLKKKPNTPPPWAVPIPRPRPTK